MATFEPDLDTFSRQIESIRAQTHRNWVCVISDDCTSPERFAEMKALLDEDERFVARRSPQRLRFYRNFERALALAPRSARYVALSDQDDEWHPDKLETLLAELGDAQLVYSDYFAGSAPLRARDVMAVALGASGEELGRLGFDRIARDMHPTVFIAGERKPRTRAG